MSPALIDLDISHETIVNEKERKEILEIQKVKMN